ncbi:polymorphic toxin-type HINT domain-containing protein [Streptomyces sp. NPDC051677]|uniref:polymorphic toxin-type HINT domain-containing protein n=1 Tax=Streptomyces sp. NPDC051677 TaxID=3365669 RepID=UPI0037D2E56F
MQPDRRLHPGLDAVGAPDPVHRALAQTGLGRHGTRRPGPSGTGRWRGERTDEDDGATKAIKDVKAGDKVLATDPATGETRTETVTAEILGKGVKHLVKVTVDTDRKNGTQTSEITATAGHPLGPEAREWIDATNLRPGEWLRTGAGTRVQVTAVTRWTVLDATVHNLTVSSLHTLLRGGGRYADPGPQL